MSARERRAMATTALVALHDDGGSFDRAFWESIPAEQRLELLWDMTLEYSEWRGDDAGQTPLELGTCSWALRPGLS